MEIFIVVNRLLFFCSIYAQYYNNYQNIQLVQKKQQKSSQNQNYVANKYTMLLLSWKFYQYNQQQEGDQVLQENGYRKKNQAYPFLIIWGKGLEKNNIFVGLLINLGYQTLINWS
eukprot:TRINITY_DN6613_c0_g1_i3.p8 TRINITY_DN6613_c0_g1~~TRINITY_DN6613_c0_g1_i3.p8  ORF type:complete len:115 (-),score=0.44 TRINITY_DN6613_c0_g1_i3:875-1219(-)